MQAKMSPLLEEAEKRWAKGEVVLHDKMATHLLGSTQHAKAAKEISRSALLKALKPVAQKYGMVRGKKREI